MSSSSSATIHIIGAGLSGLAAALIAAESGAKVMLHEAAPQAGGRCRSYHDKKLGMTIDNGNHLLLGANRAALAYLGKLGTLNQCETTEAPYYPFIDLGSRKHWHFRPPRFKGIPASEWLHVPKLLFAGKQKTVTDCIPARTALYRNLIEPLTLAALNTPPQQASAAMLGGLMRQLATGGKAAWQTYIPAHGLSAALVDPALVRIKGRGGSIRYGTALQGIEQQDGQATALIFSKERLPLEGQDRVILALPPSVLQGILPSAAPDFTYSPILNAHFAWPQAGLFRDKMPFLGVIGGTVQWIFFHEGRISTTTSAAAEHIDADEQSLATLLWHDVCRALYMDNVKLPPHRIIKEKRATYAATPTNLAKRPTAETELRNLWLAGDWLRSAYPATIEAAIASGFTAAALALGDMAEND